jgi:hypothetical protein
VAAATVFTVSGTAWAGTTIDVIFQNINAGTLSNGGRSVSVTSSATSTVANVIMTTTDQLVAGSISVQYDVSGGLQVSDAVEWVGLVVPVGKVSFQYKPLQRGDGVAANFGHLTNFIPTANITGVLSAFDGAVPPPPNTAFFSPAGTYNLGTVVWDLTGAADGFHSVAAFIAAIDGFGTIDPGGNIADITGSQVLGAGGITIVPEPGTAALLGLGLVGLMVASRRRA